MTEQEMMHPDLSTIHVTKEDLEGIITRLGREITEAYRDTVSERKLILVGILKGSFIFLADLARAVDLPLEILFLRASSYGSSAVSSGNVQLDGLPNPETLIGADVLLVEDILDSGRTLKKIYDELKDLGAHSVKICTLLNKPSGRAVDIDADFIGAEVANEFVVGYGLDYNECYRNLPYIGILKREIYS